MNDAILSIPVSIIHASPWQGRFIEGMADTSEGPDGEMLKLAESIRENGLLQPIVVRKTGDTYELIDGHRRLEAHKLLAFESIDAIVRELGDRETPGDDPGGKPATRGASFIVIGFAALTAVAFAEAGHSLSNN